MCHPQSSYLSKKNYWYFFRSHLFVVSLDKTLLAWLKLILLITDWICKSEIFMTNNEVNCFIFYFTSYIIIGNVFVNTRFKFSIHMNLVGPEPSIFLYLLLSISINWCEIMALISIILYKFASRWLVYLCLSIFVSFSFLR